MDDDTPAPSELLADELIAACIGHLTLHSLPCVARVNRRWRAAALVAFDSQLRWRADPRCFPLRLPIPAAPARAESHVARAGACIAFLRDGDLVVQLVDPAADAVRTLRFAERRPVDGEGPPEPVEACRCELGEDGPFNAGVGGMVGYRREAEEEGMAFLPTTSRHGAAAASTKRVAVGSWQNVLHCGRCVFLLRAHRSWWEDEAITADVLDLESGGVAAVDVTPLRDALEQQLSLPPAGVTFGRLDSNQLIRDEPVRCAVSAADGHFLFHASTQSGAKVAAALALPDHVAPQDGRPRGGRGGGAAAPAVSGGVVFARRWPSSHKIARLRSPLEKPCGEGCLLLWEESAWSAVSSLARGAAPLPAADPFSSRHADPASRPIALDVVLLRARSGVAAGRSLFGPAPRGRHGSVAAAFRYGGVGAIDYGAASGVVAACSLPRKGLPPPAVLVWDWRTGVCLQAVLLHPLPPAPPPAAVRPLRFPIGAQVACRMGAWPWLHGTVADHHVSHGEGGGVYLVHLDRGDSCVVPVDHPDLVRGVAGGEALAWNERAQAMEVAAEATLALHPSGCRLAVGMWHAGAAAGVAYSIGFGPGRG
mmetsp:Transcript_31571/g.104245  ORF Transcript_31571/g.104245 Transcript_31571/m.104245 type:complete len:594 (-) Transcript_31571:735-2516(-)